VYWISHFDECVVCGVLVIKFDECIACFGPAEASHFVNVSQFFGAGWVLRTDLPQTYRKFKRTSRRWIGSPRGREFVKVEV